MPDLLPAAEALAEKRCLVTLHNQPDFVLLQPIDARDTLSQEMPLLAAQTTRSFLHVAFPVEAWNVDLSPWDAPPVFGREAFGHGAADTLAWLRSRLMPEVCAKYAIAPDAPVILGGYSLAGLFSLWSAAQVDDFAAVAAVSPSVWFPAGAHMRISTLPAASSTSAWATGRKRAAIPCLRASATPSDGRTHGSASGACGIRCNGTLEITFRTQRSAVRTASRGAWLNERQRGKTHEHETV
ncbi:MAG: alpha/beta hydrolase-fold protein [Christensenellales bacterium]